MSSWHAGPVDTDVKSWFKSLNCSIKIWDWQLLKLRSYVLFSLVEISATFISFIIIIFDWMWEYEFWWFHQKDLVKTYQNQSFFNLKVYLFIYKIPFFMCKNYFLDFCCIFSQITSKIQQFCKFWNDWIGNISSISIR